MTGDQRERFLASLGASGGYAELEVALFGNRRGVTR